MDLRAPSGFVQPGGPPAGVGGGGRFWSRRSASVIASLLHTVSKSSRVVPVPVWPRASGRGRRMKGGVECRVRVRVAGSSSSVLAGAAVGGAAVAASSTRHWARGDLQYLRRRSCRRSPGAWDIDDALKGQVSFIFRLDPPQIAWASLISARSKNAVGLLPRCRIFHDERS